MTVHAVRLQDTNAVARNCTQQEKWKVSSHLSFSIPSVSPPYLKTCAMHKLLPQRLTHSLKCTTNYNNNNNPLLQQSNSWANTS